MNYEEKKELRLQISQMLADAGLNQATMKEMVISTINAKTDRAIDQCFKRLNSETPDGDYVKEHIEERIKGDFWTECAIRDTVFKALKEKALEIRLVDGVIGARRAKGTWVETDGFPDTWECSECGCRISRERPNYCPDCGALMTGRK